MKYKYIVIGYCDPDLKSGTAKIRILSKFNAYLFNCKKKDYMLFDTREEADKVAKLCKNAESYAIKVED